MQPKAQPKETKQLKKYMQFSYINFLFLATETASEKKLKIHKFGCF